MRQWICLSLLATLSLPALAGKAHLHGEGTLAARIDKDSLHLTLHLPMDVAVGFERAPRNDKERTLLADAGKRLEDGTALFVPTPAAQCTLRSREIRLPSFSGQGKEAHADIEANYRFHCAAPQALKTLDTTLFKHFRRLYRLQAQGSNGQGTMRLAPKLPQLRF